MGKKRKTKKKQRKNQQPCPPAARQDVTDELLALEAVFAEDIVISSDRNSFVLKVVPHPSDVEVNFVSLTLQVHYPADYPEEAPRLEVVSSEGISETESTALLEDLNKLASKFASTQEVFLFQLIDDCQEKLQSLNEAIVAQHHSEVDAASKSIRFEDLSLGFNKDEIPAPNRGVISKSVPEESKLKTKKRRSQATDNGKTDEDLISRQPERDRREIVVHGPAKDLDKQIYSAGVSKSMLTLVANMMEKIGPLPTSIATYLGLSQNEDAEEEDDEYMFRTEVLVGHLLRLATSRTSNALQKDAFPFLCSELHEKGILPQWLHWMLIHKPAVFDKIFNKIFEKEIKTALDVDLSSSHASQIQEFWISSEKDDIPDNTRNRISASRYETDFQEVRVFGKGGFGVVVGAINRLDSREYAIKKIKLFATSLNAYTKIIREVSTLARLQHPNVVRYFQAWLEPASGKETLASENSMDLDALIESNSSETVPQDSTTFSLYPVKRQQKNQLPSLEENSGTSYSSIEENNEPTNHPVAPEKGILASNVFFESGSGVRSVEVSIFEDEEQEVQHQILYIQMEACHRTLHQMLQSNSQLEEQEKWEILRQILRGLSYIHSQKIIHRDLKPPNIFYSATGEVKLGDFGLAKFSATSNDSVKEASSALDTNPNTPSRQSVMTEASGVCGTSFYIAPEIENHWPSYDNKVDMYSLGIVVFELWHPFGTAMERILTLKDLKEKGALPLEWKTAFPQVAELVLWLLSPNPAARPTAKEVLRSEFLPARVGDEQIQDLIRSFEDDTETYDRVIDGIFKCSKATQRSDGQSLVVSDFVGAPTIQSQAQLRFQDQLISDIKELFSRHGATQMTSQEMGFPYGELPNNAVRVMSITGDLCSLKYDMRYPFVKWVVQELEKTESNTGNTALNDSLFPIDNFRRYDLDWICLEGTGLTLVRKHLQADLDFITAPLPRITEALLHDQISLHKLLYEQLLPEAELLKIISEVAHCFHFSEEESILEIRLTHVSLLHRCLTEVDLKEKEVVQQALYWLARMTKYSPLGNGRNENWGPVQAALEGLRLTSSQIRNFKRFVIKLAGSNQQAISQLLSAFSNGAQRKIPSSTLLALEEINILVRLLEKWGLSGDQVLVDPIMTPETDYYSGIHFQVHLIHPVKQTGNVLAYGGRYDKLLNHLWKTQNSGSNQPHHGIVGTTFNLSPFIRQKLDSMTSIPTWKFASDVLVCSKGGGITSLERRMELISTLWSQGVKAEMLHKVSPTMTAQYDHAAASGIKILIIIDEQIFSSCETVKIKNLDRKQEDEVPFTEVPNFILNLIQNKTSGMKTN